MYFRRSKTAQTRSRYFQMSSECENQRGQSGYNKARVRSRGLSTHGADPTYIQRKCVGVRMARNVVRTAYQMVSTLACFQSIWDDWATDLDTCSPAMFLRCHGSSHKSAIRHFAQISERDTRSICPRRPHQCSARELCALSEIHRQCLGSCRPDRVRHHCPRSPEFSTQCGGGGLRSYLREV
jgi:hypothetical protein